MSEDYKESINFRVQYPNGAVYHLLASSDVKEIENFEKYFRGIPYTQYNGVVSLYSESNAELPPKEDRNMFLPNGTARKVAEKYIEEILNKLNNSKPLFITEY